MGDNQSMQRNTFLFVALALTGAALSGCGAASSLVNSVIPEIDNLAALNDTTVDATVGSGRAVISGNVSKTSTFPDRDLPEQIKLKRLKLRQSLDRQVQVTLPAGAAAPASFTLKNIALSVKLSDSSSRSVETSKSLDGPITFTREAATNVYSVSAPVEVSGVTFDSSKFSTARDIITTAPSPNTVVARVSFDAESTELPNGTVLRFKLVGGKAKVEL